MLDEEKINTFANDIIALAETQGLSFQEVQQAIFKTQQLVQMGISEKLSDLFTVEAVEAGKAKVTR